MLLSQCITLTVISVQYTSSSSLTWENIISKQMAEMTNYALPALFLHKQQPLTLLWKLRRWWRTYGCAQRRRQLGQKCRGTQPPGPRLISPNETSMKHFVLSSTLGNLVSLPCRMNIPKQYQSPRRSGAGAGAAACKHTNKVKWPQYEVKWPWTLGIGGFLCEREKDRKVNARRDSHRLWGVLKVY